jgi:hypothetical protein
MAKTMNRNDYYKMRKEMWTISELEYACVCAMESFDTESYDGALTDVVEIVYGYNSQSAKKLIKEAEYVLRTFYETDHARNTSWKYGFDEERKECAKEIKNIKRWLKKWKLFMEGIE